MAKKPSKKAIAKKQVKGSAPVTRKKKAAAKKKSASAKSSSAGKKVKPVKKKRVTGDNGEADVLKHVFFMDDGA